MKKDLRVPVHLYFFVLLSYNKETGIARMIMKGSTENDIEREYLVHPFAREEFEKILPKLPCVIHYLEESRQQWACISIVESETKRLQEYMKRRKPSV